MFDLVKMQAEKNRSELKMTVLRRPGGKWAESEVNKLRNRLRALVGLDANHPEYTILSGNYTKAQVFKVLGRGEDFIVTWACGLETVELPFAPKFE